jgi:hypothetical protein
MDSGGGGGGDGCAIQWTRSIPGIVVVGTWMLPRNIAIVIMVIEIVVPVLVVVPVLERGV